MPNDRRSPMMLLLALPSTYQKLQAQREPIGQPLVIKQSVGLLWQDCAQTTGVAFHSTFYFCCFFLNFSFRIINHQKPAAISFASSLKISSAANQAGLRFHGRISSDGFLSGLEAEGSSAPLPFVLCCWV